MLVKPLPRPAGEGGKALTMYQRRMRWLSQQIFGTLHKQQFQIAPDTGGNSNARFSKDWRVARYFSEKPVHSRHDLIDLYYPPYAEIDGLMTKLRQYGLFRNEHLDFTEEMERLRQMRGKTSKYISKGPNKDKTKTIGSE